MMGPVYAKFPNVDIKISGCVSIEPLGDVSYKDADPLQVYVRMYMIRVSRANHAFRMLH